MRRSKTASKKRSQLAKEAQDTATRIERLYQDAATTGLKAMTSHPSVSSMMAFGTSPTR